MPQRPKIDMIFIGFFFQKKNFQHLFGERREFWERHQCFKHTENSLRASYHGQGMHLPSYSDSPVDDFGVVFAVVAGDINVQWKLLDLG